MKNIFLLLTLLYLTVSIASAQQALDRATQPAAEKKKPFRFPKSENFQLDNGLRVQFIRKKNVPMVEMTLVFNAGTTKESFAKAGVASLTNRMLPTGTKTKNYGAITGTIEKYGLGLSTFTNYEYSLLTMRSLSDYFQHAINILSDIAQRPAFDKEYFEAGKQSFRSNLEYNLRDVSQIATILFYTQIYGQQHAYARTFSGTFQSLDSLTIEDVRYFHSAFYRPNNATLYVVGDVDPVGAMKIIHEEFDGWEKGNVPQVQQASIPIADSLRILTLHDSASTRVQIRIGNLSIARSSPEFHALLLFNRIIGGDVFSRLSKNLMIEKKVAANMRTAYGFHTDAGFFVATGTSEGKAVVSIVNAALEEMTAMMKKSVSDAELLTAKRALKKSYALEFETNTQLIQKLIEANVFSLHQNSFEEYEEQIDHITKEDIKRAAQLSLNPDRATVILIGNAYEFADELMKKFPTQVRYIAP